MDHQTIGPHFAVSGKSVLDRHLLQLGDHRLRIVGAGRFDGLQILKGRGIHPGLNHRGFGAGLLLEFRTPFPGLVVEVPVKAGGQRQPLSLVEPERVDIGDEEKKRGELLAALDDAEFLSLFHRVLGIGAGIGEADHLSTGALGLKEEGREVLGGEGRGDFADDFAAILGDGIGGGLLQIVTEGVVGGDEEPALIAFLDHGDGRSIGQRVGVIGPVQGGLGCAGLVGQAVRGAAIVDIGDALLGGQFLQRDADAGIGAAQDEVDILLIDPLAGDVGADIGFVLVIGGKKLDRSPVHCPAHLFDGHLDGRDRSFPVERGIGAGHVQHHADLDRVTADRPAILGMGRDGEGACGAGQQHRLQIFHSSILPWVPPSERHDCQSFVQAASSQPVTTESRRQLCRL